MDDNETKILVVEDDPTVRALMVSILARPQRAVAVVDSAEEALSHIENNPVDLFLVDKNLPGMDGVELIGRIRSQDKVAGILMVTGYASPDSALRTLNLGIDGYLQKPFDVSTIEQRVVEALERRDRRAQLHDTLERARGQLRSMHEKAPVNVTAITFLVASPSHDERARLKRYLASHEDAVEVVDSSSGCLEKLAAGRFDIVVLDSMLSNPGVVQVARTALAGPDKPICVVVGERPDVEDLQQLIHLEVKAVIERHDVATQFRNRVGSLAEGLRLTRMTKR